MRTLRYGAAPSQCGDLHLPAAERPPVLCLLHGGFWRMPYGRDPLTPLAEDLARRGFAVWNLSYRRVGEPGGGWPGTVEDVAAGLDALAQAEVPLDLATLTVIGHSAGGHLALASAFAGAAQVRVHRIVGLAAVSDLDEARRLDLGRGAVKAFLGAAPLPPASPAARLPLGLPQVLIHGAADEAVPIDLSRRYAAKAQAAGDAVTLVELPRAGHMDFLDLGSEAYAALCRTLGC